MARLRRIIAFFRRWWRTERRGLVALLVLVLVAVLAACAPLFTQNPDTIDALKRLGSPSGAHWFGTDEYGRDILSRVIYAGRVSLELGVLVTSITAVVGTALGMLAGYYRKLDTPVMRLMDGMMAFPPIVLAIALVAALGAGLFSEVAALSVVFTPRVARIAYGSTLQLKGSEYVEAARASGSRVRTILARHLLPNSLGPLVVQASFIYAETILFDAALSFLGLGVAPPAPTWGNMIAAARTYLTVSPWFAVFPGLAIVISATSLNLVGDSLRHVVQRGPVDPAGGPEKEALTSQSPAVEPALVGDVANLAGLNSGNGRPPGMTGPISPN